MSLDIEKCPVKEIDETKDGESNQSRASYRYVNFENLIFLIIIACLISLITLQLFTQTIKIQLETDSPWVIVMANEEGLQGPVIDRIGSTIPKQNTYYYSWNNHVINSIGANVINSSDDSQVLRINLSIQRENTSPILDWLKSLFSVSSRTTNNNIND